MKIIFTGRGVKVTKGIRAKVQEMMSKHKKLLRKVNKIDVELKHSKPHRGIDTDIKLEITVTMPRALIRVEEKGSDLYTIVDGIDPILRRRLIRYHDHEKKLEGKESWRTLENKKFEKEIENIKEDDYVGASDVKPVITRYKEYSKNSPMYPAEAIERMELLGHEAFLFKNIENGKYAMVYKKSDGTYGLVEPKES